MEPAVGVFDGWLIRCLDAIEAARVVKGFFLILERLKTCCGDLVFLSSCLRRVRFFVFRDRGGVVVSLDACGGRVCFPWSVVVPVAGAGAGMID